HLFVVPVSGGAAIRNFSPPRGHTCGVQQRRHQLRLAGAAVTYNANVSNVLGEIGFHADSPFFCGASESRFGDPREAMAAKVRRLVSSTDLRPIEFSTVGGRAPVLIEASCGSLPSNLARALGLRAGGGEGESKDSLERSSFTADASTRVGSQQRNTR